MIGDTRLLREHRTEMVAVLVGSTVSGAMAWILSKLLRRGKRGVKGEGPTEVIILWDIENCPVPDNLTFAEVVT